jgi:hypothetical protein
MQCNPSESFITGKIWQRNVWQGNNPESPSSHYSAKHSPAKHVLTTPLAFSMRRTLAAQARWRRSGLESQPSRLVSKMSKNSAFDRAHEVNFTYITGKAIIFLHGRRT